LILAYYAKVQADDNHDRTRKFTQDDERLDSLAAFLADVDVDEYDPENWKREKPSRILDSDDASYVLSFYAKQQVLPSDTPAWDIWDDVLNRELARV